MLGAFQKIGHWFRSAQGWIYVTGTLPGIIASIAAYLEGRPWSELIALGVVALAAGMIVVALALWVWRTFALYLTTRKDQQRILVALNNLGENVTKLDLPTAAAIWAGTADQASVERHVHFRGLKNAVDRGEIKAVFMDRKKANVNTVVDIESLKDFWRNKGVIP